MNLYPLIDPYAVHYSTYVGGLYTLASDSIALTAGTLTAAAVTTTGDGKVTGLGGLVSGGTCELANGQGLTWTGYVTTKIKNNGNEIQIDCGSVEIAEFDQASINFTVPLYLPSNGLFVAEDVGVPVYSALFYVPNLAANVQYTFPAVDATIASVADLAAYQPLHANLTSLAGMATTVGFVKQTSANTFGIDATTYLPLAGGTMTGVIVLPLGSVSAPCLALTGDTNTGWYSAGDGSISFTSNGSTVFSIGSVVQFLDRTFLQVVTSNSAYPDFWARRRRTSGGGGGGTGVINNDILGNMLYAGYDGASAYPTGGQIRCTATETWSATSSAARLDLYTTPTTTIIPVKRITILPSGFVGINNDTPTVALDVTGAGLFSTTLGVTGAITCGSTIKTVSNVTWDLGALTTAAAVLDAAHYLNVTVGSVAYKIALIT